MFYVGAKLAYLVSPSLTHFLAVRKRTAMLWLMVSLCFFPPGCGVGHVFGLAGDISNLRKGARRRPAVPSPNPRAFGVSAARRLE